MAHPGIEIPKDLDKPALYAHVHAGLAALLEGERDFIANAANCSAVVYQSLPHINWAGFYLAKDADLVLGPFQGKPACVRIGPGRGVCGAAVLQRKTLIVPDVHRFPGHIACDAASRSEIVVPLIKSDRIIGVFDLDSPQPNRFDECDADGLRSLAALLLAASDV